MPRHSTGLLVSPMDAQNNPSRRDESQLDSDVVAEYEKEGSWFPTYSSANGN